MASSHWAVNKSVFMPLGNTMCVFMGLTCTTGSTVNSQPAKILTVPSLWICEHSLELQNSLICNAGIKHETLCPSTCKITVINLFEQHMTVKYSWQEKWQKLIWAIF